MTDHILDRSYARLDRSLCSFKLTLFLRQVKEIRQFKQAVMRQVFGSDNPDQVNIDDFITDAQEPESDDDDDEIWLDFSKEPPKPINLDDTDDEADVVLQECWPN